MPLNSSNTVANENVAEMSGSGLDQVIVTTLLRQRPSRPPDHAAESRAFLALAQAMGDAPLSVLQRLADAALELTGADSAGISVLENDGEKPVFRWRATAGAFFPFAQGTLPRDFSPCGVVLDRNAPQLMCDPVRVYPYIANLQPHVSEVLLVPFHCGDRPIGTVWVVAHTDAKHFDAEDERVITSLSKFASAAVQVVSKVEESEAHARLLEAEVAERTRADEALRASEERNRRLVETAHEGIWTIDAEGRTTYVNQRMAELLGYAPEEMIGRVHTDFMLEQDRPKGDLDMERRREGTAAVWDQRYRRKDGSELWTVASCNALYDPEGKFAGALGMFTDITRRKRAEAERQALLDSERAARAEADMANRGKDRFLAVLSHELRTPLTPVALTAMAMEMDPALPSDFREDVAMIRRNVELETRLIDDLLDHSRVTSGKLRLNVQPTHVHEAIRHVLQTVGAEFHEKQLRVEEVLGATDDCVDADPTRLQQTLWNLLKNAAKFTPSGGRVFVKTRNDGGHLLIDVGDDGRGIAPEALPHVFDPFEQGDADVTRQYGGMGLGLAIAKAVVDLHGGTISAASDGVGRGAVFTVALPLGKAVSPADPVRADDAASGEDRPVRLLLVEDHADSAKVLVRLLRQEGTDVQWAGTVAAALELAASEPFDVVVSDLGLPDGTGYHLMRELLRQRPVAGIAMSGYGMDDDVRQSREAGFVEHLVKPVDLSQLRDAIRRVVKDLG